jgi:SH3-like domain-containing protein
VETLGRSGSFYLIRDPAGAKGWIHHSQLSRKRTVMVRNRPAKAGPLPLMARPQAKGRPRALLEPGVVAELVGCDGEWRRIEVGRAVGWAPAKALYAADPCPAPG